MFIGAGAREKRKGMFWLFWRNDHFLYKRGGVAMNNDNKQAWLGRVHVHAEEEKQTLDYSVVVAVWANSQDDYQTTLVAHQLSSHLSVQGVQQVVPAIEWLKRHPSDQDAIALARSVHPQWSVAFGELTPLTQQEQTTATNDAHYLTINTIENIEPISEAFPEHYVPEALRTPLFGQPEPTDDDIARYGSRDAVPPMNTYAIIEAANVFYGADLLEDSGLEYGCLLKDDIEYELKETAPYLVELTADNTLTQILFSFRASFSEEHATVHLWHKEAAIYMRSRDSLRDLQLHLRQFTRVYGAHNKRYWFRFWDTSYLLSFLQHGSPANVASLMSDHHFFLLDANLGQCTHLYRTPNVFVDTTMDKFTFYSADLSALKQASTAAFTRRTLSWLRKSYGYLHNRQQAFPLVQQAIQHATTIWNITHANTIVDFVATAWLSPADAEALKQEHRETPSDAKSLFQRAHKQAFEDVFGDGI